jgi:hypothetical protein
MSDSELNCDILEANAVLTTKTACIAEPMDLVVEDWNMMFHAVLERLKKTVDDVLVAAPLLPSSDASNSVHTVVLECVDALGHLHTALKHERARWESTGKSRGNYD